MRVDMLLTVVGLGFMACLLIAGKIIKHVGTAAIRKGRENHAKSGGTKILVGKLAAKAAGIAAKRAIFGK